jgi:chloramphenicol 3-O-phosphotransferase
MSADVRVFASPLHADDVIAPQTQFVMSMKVLQNVGLHLVGSSVCLHNSFA